MNRLMSKSLLFSFFRFIALLSVLSLCSVAWAETDPATLDQAIGTIKSMRDRNASNREVADYLSGVIDRRLSSINRVSWSGGDSYGLFLPGPGEIAGGEKSEWSRRFDRFNRERETFGKPPGEITRSDLTERALWAWHNRVGNCNEAQSVSFYILNRAGIPVRAVTSNAGSGHDFVVIGFDKGFNANDPSTWGLDAMVVDGWTGDALTSEEARESDYHGNNGRAVMSDRTSIVYRPGQDRLWERLAGKGILFVQATEKKTRQGLDGITVQVKGREYSKTATTANGGKVTLTVPAGAYTIRLQPASGTYKPASGSVEVRERRRAELSIPLESVDKEMAGTATSAAARLTGHGSVTYGIQVTGSAHIVNNRGSLTLKMDIDVRGQTVSGSLEGGASGTLVSDDYREKIFASVTGPLSGSYTGNDVSGNFRGSISIVQSGTGGTVRGRGSFSGSMSNRRVRCEILLGEERFEFRFPVEEN